MAEQAEEVRSVEKRTFSLETLGQTLSPFTAFAQNTNANADHLFKEAMEDREAFWANQASILDWFEPWQDVLQWNPPNAKWFVGGKLNACYNCLDRHMYTEKTRNKVALFWEGESGEKRSFTYQELYKEVNCFSNALKKLGIRKGDRVAIYLPMIPEAVIAMLSCARIGAVHTVVFAGFSPDSLKDRMLDAEVKLLITADGGVRKGKEIPLKEMADIALNQVPSLESVIVVEHTKTPVTMKAGRDFFYGKVMEGVEEICAPEVMDAEDPLYILYTSGTTGKPKGIVHTTGGYMLGATLSTRLIFDATPSDVYWCTADVGWVTGHTYVVYGPLSNGMTQLLYEGAFDFPQKDRCWKLIEKYKVSLLYTAPTAIRLFMKWGESWLKTADLSSLRLLGSVGEPINPEAWMWYYTHIGGSRCPVVDTWWQTETGSILIAPVPSLTPLKPGSAAKPLPGIEAAILDEEGNPATTGFLAILSPWPSMARGIYKDPDRFKQTYWNKWKSPYYFTGDGAKKDEEGYFWLMGRVDDVMNVSGHRLGTMEIESALVSDRRVAEAAVIGIPHEIKGQGVVAFVSLKEGTQIDLDLEPSLKEQVVYQIGAIARPEKILFIRDLPKTRSGKIMRRLLRDIAEGRVLGDMTTLLDPTLLEEIKSLYQEDS
jgi:acetyl-CoA synthetase